MAAESTILHEISRLGERLAVHPLCAAGHHQTVTVAAHHAVCIKQKAFSLSVKDVLPHFTDEEKQGFSNTCKRRS